MPHQRTRHSAEFKAWVALDALSGLKTIAELASEHKVHPTQITRWKQELTENAANLFGKAKKKEANHEAEVAELHRPGFLRHFTYFSRIPINGVASVPRKHNDNQKGECYGKNWRESRSHHNNCRQWQ